MTEKRKEFLKMTALCAGTCAVVAVLMLKVFMFVHVSGNSMNDTYQNGDLVFGNRITDYSKGDVVICSTGKKNLIKRIIAVGGDTVDIDFETGDVTVNGEILDEPYIKEKTFTDEGMEFPVTVPEKSYFVMGDNRNHSTDSRSLDVGFIPEERMKSKVIFSIG